MLIRVSKRAPGKRDQGKHINRTLVSHTDTAVTPFHVMYVVYVATILQKPYYYKRPVRYGIALCIHLNGTLF